MPYEREHHVETRQAMGMGAGEAQGRAEGDQGHREREGKTIYGNGSQICLRPATPEAATLELHRRHFHEVARHLLLLRSQICLSFSKRNLPIL